MPSSTLDWRKVGAFGAGFICLFAGWPFAALIIFVVVGAFCAFGLL